MIKPTPEWRRFERDYIRNQPKGWHANVGAYVEMLDWVMYLGKWPLDANPLDGIEDDIKLRRMLNARLPIPVGEDRGLAE